MKNKWRVSGSVYKISETSTEIDTLPVAIYKMGMSMFGPFLTRLEDKFSLPEKIYGSDKNLVERVYRTFHATTGNLGVLLNGLKGTGKTLTSKMICNRMDLPVIIIDNSYNGGTADFIAEIPQDVVLFFDEYEKNFSTGKNKDGDEDHTLLSVMDGAMNSDSRKIFLLTTNSPRVNDNMVQRPGRIRYLKTFSDLSKDVIIEIVDDKLLNSDLKKATVDFISKLEIISMDIITSIIEEVNIHNEEPEKFKDVFNVEQKEDTYNVYTLTDGRLEAFKHRAGIDPEVVSEDMADGSMSFYINGRDMGNIVGVVGIGSDEEGYKVKSRSLTPKGYEDRETIYIIEKVHGVHHSFVDYAY